MKYRLITCAIFFVWLCTGLVAQPITIQSGEHPGFSRLALELPKNMIWRIIEGPGVQTIKMRGHEDGFIVDSVFSKIPRHRVDAIRNDHESFSLILNCRCPIRNFIFEGNYLILDIVDGPALTEVEVQERDIFQMNFSLPSTEFGYKDLLWSKNSVNNGGSNGSGEVGQLINNGPVEENLGDPELIESIIIDEIQEAAQAGILNGEHVSDVQSENASHALARDGSSHTSEASNKNRFSETNGNIRVLTRQENLTSHDYTETGKDCKDSEALALHTWDLEGRKFSDVGQLVFKTFEFDNEPKIDAVVELVKHYLWFGFGAEAKKVLDSFTELNGQYAQYYDMAEILDFGIVRNPRVLHRRSDCGSEGALWSFLTNSAQQDAYITNVDTIVEEFQSLPSKLRQLIGIPLTLGLKRTDNWDAAKDVVRILSRDSHRQRKDSSILEAQVNIHNGNVANGHTELWKLANHGGIEAFEALSALVNSKSKERMAVDHDIAVLAESFTFQLKGSSLEVPSLKIFAQSLILSKDFARALVTFNNDIFGVSDDEFHNDFHSLFLDMITANATDSVFLQNVFDDPNRFLRAKTTGNFLATATRLYRLGFHEMAADFIDNVADRDMDQSALLTKAKIQLRLGEAQSAISTLFGLNSDEAALVRSEAFETLGSSEQTFFAADSIGDQNGSSRGASMASSWEQLVGGQDEELQILRELALENLFDLESSAVTLNDLAEFLEINEVARRKLVKSISFGAGIMEN